MFKSVVEQLNDKLCHNAHRCKQNYQIIDLSQKQMQSIRINIDIIL